MSLKYFVAQVVLGVGLLTLFSLDAMAQRGGRNDFTPAKIVPVEGPAATTPFVTRPWEVTFYTNAVNVLNADYVDADSQVVGGLFVATTQYNVYDLTRVSTTRSHGGKLLDVELYTSDNRSFIVETLENTSGETEFVIPVIGYRNGPDFIFDSRFVTDQYRHPGTPFEEIVNMELWGSSKEFVTGLLEETMRYYTQFGFLDYINTTSNPPDLSALSFHSGRYNAGRLFLKIFNTIGRTRVTIRGTVAVTETQSRIDERIPFEELVDVPASEAGEPVEVELDIGTVYDAAILMHVGTTYLDRSYFPDGTWGFAAGRAVVNEFETFEEIRFDPSGFAVARSVFMRGSVTGWASAYRFFRFAGTPTDLSAYDQLEFTAFGQGNIRLFLEKQELMGLVQFGYSFPLEPDRKRYVVPFDDLGQLGEIGGFDGRDVTALQFYVLGNSRTPVPFDVLIEDVTFTRSDGVAVDVADASELPKTIELADNYPNPFNPATTISFALPTATDVRLTVFDVLGRALQTLTDAYLPAGQHTASFDATGFPSGTYLYRLEAGEQTITKTMLLLK